MELTQLKYFLAVAKNQHVTRAASELHVAQPAVTQAIHRLEDELGVPLFTAKGRNIVLSPYGKYFYEKLQPLISALNELPRELRSLADLENNTIYLNVLAASNLITHAIIEYQRIDESLHIHLSQNEHSDFYDISVTTKVSRKPNDKEKIFVCREESFLAVPNSGKFKDMSCIRLQDVKDQGFIMLSGAKIFRRICDRFFQQAGIFPKIFFESDTTSAIQNMIAANMGVGFWPDFSWERLNSHRVKLLPITDSECSRDIVISCKHNKTDNTKTEAFYHFLVQYIHAAAKNKSEDKSTV